MSPDDLFNEPAEPEREVLTVRQVNEEISAAIERSFPRTVWVRGEVQRLPSDAARRTHVYFELHETGGTGAAEYQISTSLMGWDRQRFGLGRYLDGTDPDFQIANKIEVCLECKVDFYAKFGKMSLKVVGVDKNFSLGRLEARRRQVMEYLKKNELLDLNQSLPWPELPLRIGLITAPGSAAEHDFMTGLGSSPWGFAVELRGARMQGDQLQPEVIRALKTHAVAGVDVIVITRGGGSRADLSWFDQKDLAVAIANCPVPVVTAIGHEVDTSIADLVAHHACKTPTAAAEFLVSRVDEAAARVEKAAGRMLELVDYQLTVAAERINLADRLARASEGVRLRARLRFQHTAGRLQDKVARFLAARTAVLTGLRSRLATVTVIRTSRARERLGVLGSGISRAAVARKTEAGGRVSGLAGRLGRQAGRPIGLQITRLEGLATQARLMDPQRLLARGYTITVDDQGRSVTGASALAAGDVIGTRFHDGQVQSIVQPGEKVSTRRGKGGKRVPKSGSKKKEMGQDSLF